MASERIYFHVVFSVTRGKPVFLDESIDRAFKQLAHEIAQQRGWVLLEIETMPNNAHILLEKDPHESLSQLIGYLKGRTARTLLQQFGWLRGDLNSYHFSYHFWNRGFYHTRHTDESLPTVRAYIRNQRRAGGLAD
ncbi:MAG TPA: IS200/IS605 family transposase [Thermomicrobiales bacterium]|nr:IS200/IS605 family transposase [Thermomicrobiales bacterium]